MSNVSSSIRRNSLVGIGAARLGTWVHKTLLTSERDISQGKYRLLLTAHEAIVGSSRWKQLQAAKALLLHMHGRLLLPDTLSVLECHFMKYTDYSMENNGACTCSSPQAFPHSSLRYMYNRSS